MGFSFFSDLINPTKYDIPEAPQIDTSGEQLANVEGNYASFQGAQKLATEFNSFMQEQVAKQLRETMPEFAGLQKQMAANLASQLKGELPSDVAGQVQRRSGAKSLALGIAGSPASTNLSARDLGINSLQLQQSAQAQTPGYLSSIASLTRAPLFDFSSVFLSPMQRIGVSQWNKESAWNVANMKNQMDAQPEPWMRAFAGLGDSAMNLGGILGSSYVAGVGSSMARDAAKQQAVDAVASGQGVSAASTSSTGASY
jgi:hypothetical protein